jgi:hypothetical protein
MNICIFDTETTSLEKPFCYNIGYVIVDTETRETVLQREYVVEQVWSNLELFCSAYYADKRPDYVKRMRGRTVTMEKYGYITQQMIRDFKSFKVEQAYAYNSPFDEKVFNFCCEWFKTINPFEIVNVFDIRGYVHNKIAFTPEFKQFCEVNEYFTESGNYSTTAETLFRYITNNNDFNEAHTALDDSKIESQILFDCIDKGAEFGVNYTVYQSIPRMIERTLTIVQNDKRTTFNYYKRTNRKDTIYLK